jgi:hypothetical protein
MLVETILVQLMHFDRIKTFQMAGCQRNTLCRKHYTDINEKAKEKILE